MALVLYGVALIIECVWKLDFELTLIKSLWNALPLSVLPMFMLRPCFLDPDPLALGSYTRV